jgi:abortive infection bacteriophage resistance protein
MSTYTKPYLSVEQQIDHIKNVFLCDISDEHNAKNFLRRVGFYKTQQYFHDLKSGKIPIVNTTDSILFEDVIFFYEMDRQLSGLFFTCITEIEIALRSKFCDLLATNPFEYQDKKFWHNINRTEKDPKEINRSKMRENWLKKLTSKVEELETRHVNDLNSKGCNCTNVCKASSCQCKARCNYNCQCGCNKTINPVVMHIKNNNPTPKNKLPLWIALELLDFGSLSYLYDGISDSNRKPISSSLKLDNLVLLKLLKSLNVLRNYCAHNNKIMANITFTPPKIHVQRHLYPNPSVITNTSNIFVYIIACYHFIEKMELNMNFIKNFYTSLESMDSYSKYDFSQLLGIDKNWKSLPIW